MMVVAEIYRRKEQYDPRCITKLVSNVSAKWIIITMMMILRRIRITMKLVCRQG